MAGMGKRMRPHTLSVPKPLIPLAGKPVVKHLVSEITKVVPEKIEEISFVVGDFGIDVENELIAIAASYGAIGKIYHQHDPLGTAHAVYCAKESLKGPVIVAFADTLFSADFKLDSMADGTIWVKEVEEPHAFGVVKINSENIITDFIEKPQDYVSNLAIIGIYFFKQAEILSVEIKNLIDNDIKVKGEFQLTDALENMKSKGIAFVPGKVNEWLDCGNKNATILTNQQLLKNHEQSELIADSSKIDDSVILKPCYIGNNVIIKNSVIGPHVSVGDNTTIESSIIKNSIIQQSSTLKSLTIQNSMIGNFVDYRRGLTEVNVGDYTTIS